jgi:hypothetical protein
MRRWARPAPHAVICGPGRCTPEPCKRPNTLRLWWCICVVRWLLRSWCSMRPSARAATRWVHHSRRQTPGSALGRGRRGWCGGGGARGKGWPQHACASQARYSRARVRSPLAAPPPGLGLPESHRPPSPPRCAARRRCTAAAGPTPTLRSCACARAALSQRRA